MPSLTNAPITDWHYGAATPEIQALLDLADRASEAFRARAATVATPVEIEALVRSHLDRIAAAGVGVIPAMAGMTFIRADALLGARFGQRPDPEAAWGPDWAPYRDAVRDLRRRLYNIATSDPVRRAHIVPPLWPFPGQPAICSEPRIARGFNTTAPVPWLMLCELEDALTDALLWAVTRPDSADNPFRPLLELGALGLAPLGLKRERFVIYIPVEAGALNNGLETEDLA